MLVPLAVMVAVATVTVSGQALCWYREWTTVVGQWCLL